MAVLHLSFTKLNTGEENKQSSNQEMSNEKEVWVKLQNTIFMEEVLVHLCEQSFIFAKLLNVYMSLYLNNIAIFFICVWYSTFVQPISLQWSLMIIIVNRYTFFTVFRRVVFSENPAKKIRVSIKQILKLNAFLIPYYFYAVSHISYINNLFIFLLVNSLFRI